MSIDPLSELEPDISPYTYTANNPINAIDPDGKSWIWDDEKHDWVWVPNDDPNYYAPDADPVEVIAESKVPEGYTAAVAGKTVHYYMEDSERRDVYEAAYDMRHSTFTFPLEFIMNILKGVSAGHLAEGVLSNDPKISAFDQLASLVFDKLKSKGVDITPGVKLSVYAWVETVMNPARSSQMPGYPIEIGKGANTDTLYFDPSVDRIIKVIRHHNNRSIDTEIFRF